MTNGAGSLGMHYKNHRFDTELFFLQNLIQFRKEDGKYFQIFYQKWAL